MKRTPILVLLGLAFAFVAGSASAATSVALQVVGPTTVAAGSSITLNGVVTANDATTDNAVFGALNQPGAAAATLTSGGSQVNLSTVGTAAQGWSSGALTCTTAFCVVFSQVNGTAPATAGVTNLTIGSIHAAIAAGLPNGTVINFTWRTTPSTQRLDWYGVSSAPGASVTIGGVIPEPTTAALLGFGILGLALSGRRRA